MITMYMSEELDELEKNNNEYILGVLAEEDDEDIPSSGETKTPVTVEKDLSGIRFYIKPLSEEADIISELNGTLNMDYEVSNDLRSLYTFIKSRLIDANIEKDMDIIDEIIPIMEDMRDTWKEAMKIARASKS